jgi:hypothetical protein
MLTAPPIPKTKSKSPPRVPPLLSPVKGKIPQKLPQLPRTPSSASSRGGSPTHMQHTFTQPSLLPSPPSQIRPPLMIARKQRKSVGGMKLASLSPSKLGTRRGSRMSTISNGSDPNFMPWFVRTEQETPRLSVILGERGDCRECMCGGFAGRAQSLRSECMGCGHIYNNHRLFPGSEQALETKSTRPSTESSVHTLHTCCKCRSCMSITNNYGEKRSNNLIFFF